MQQGQEGTEVKDTKNQIYQGKPPGGDNAGMRLEVETGVLFLSCNQCQPPEYRVGVSSGISYGYIFVKPFSVQVFASFALGVDLKTLDSQNRNLVSSW